MRALLVGTLIALMVFMTPGVSTASSNADRAKQCQAEYASLGYTNVGQCVSNYARGGGGVVTGPASLTLTFEETTCALYPQNECIWSVQGTGLDPGSKVIVGGVEVLYGAEITVGSDGTVDMRGIYLAGTCVVEGYEIQNFVARGIAAGGTPIESAVVTADLTDILPNCNY